MTYIAVSGLSHVGLVRDNNEDSLVVGPWTLCGTETDSPQTLVFPVGETHEFSVHGGFLSVWRVSVLAQPGRLEKTQRTLKPGETIEFTACPIRPCQPCTNLAGGWKPASV